MSHVMKIGDKVRIKRGVATWGWSSIGIRIWETDDHGTIMKIVDKMWAHVNWVKYGGSAPFSLDNLEHISSCPMDGVI